MPADIITVNNLSAMFGQNHILQDVSFTARKNEITVILGKSGSGKTMILKHLIGLFPVQEGHISIMGQDVEDCDEEELRQLRLKFGVLFQNGALLNSLTIAENIAIPLEQHTNLSREIITDLIRVKLSLVGLDHAAGLLPSQLSGGMRKRAALARALALDPPLLFCDEPSAGLDPVTLNALDSLILNLKNQLQMTIVLVTHEVSSIYRLADRIVFLAEGSVVYEGSLNDALKSKHSELREFFNMARGKGPAA
jgi:phospholipid/cholesterol/gamma-HCH transport system ATP-binding protein